MPPNSGGIAFRLAELNAAQRLNGTHNRRVNSRTRMNKINNYCVSKINKKLSRTQAERGEQSALTP